MFSERSFISLLVALFLSGALDASGHQVSSVSLVARLDTEEKEYLLDVAMEVIPSEEQELNDQISPEEASRQFAEDYLNVLFDEAEQTPNIEISMEDVSDEDTPAELQRQQVLANLTGRIPEGAKEFLLYLEPTCPMAVVMVVIKDTKPSRRMQVILAGEFSRPVNVEKIQEGDPFLEAEKATSRSAAMAPEEPPSGEAAAEAVVPITNTNGGPAPFKEGWKAFFAPSLIPALLLVAILLLTMNGRSIFHQIAALLLGQGTVIALVAWGVVAIPDWFFLGAAVVLACLSLEAVFHHEMRWWRLPLVALGGVFAAGAMTLTPHFYAAIESGGNVDMKNVVLFLLGTDAAFIVVGGIAAALLIFLSRKDWYRKAVVQPLVTVLAAYALYLVIEPML